MWSVEGCGWGQRGVEGGDEGTDATDVQRDQTFFFYLMDAGSGNQNDIPNGKRTVG